MFRDSSLIGIGLTGVVFLLLAPAVVLIFCLASYWFAALCLSVAKLFVTTPEWFDQGYLMLSTFGILLSEIFKAKVTIEKQ